jgi:hypothetical protein
MTTDGMEKMDDLEKGQLLLVQQSAEIAEEQKQAESRPCCKVNLPLCYSRATNSRLIVDYACCSHLLLALAPGHFHLCQTYDLYAPSSRSSSVHIGLW